MAETRKLSWLTVDLNNDEELDALHAQECAEAVGRAKAAIAELQRLGIIDENGERIRKDVPEDMREGSECDMSAL